MTKMQAEKLTTKQNDLLEIIRSFIEREKENPTGYKLQKYLVTIGNRESLKSIMQVVEALEKKDLLKRDKNHKIYLIENDSYANLENILSIPLYGLASCGEALAYADDRAEDYLQISTNLFGRTKSQLFAVKALGDSMDSDHINDGDFVIFEKCENPNLNELNGKIIVAVINGMATIKRFKKIDKETIALFPNSSNVAHHPIYLHKSDSILIAGIFKKVLPVKYVSL
jgi:SOS-response transcriptional repressor LexA